MPFTIKPLYINTKTLKGSKTDKPSQGIHADLAKWQRRYNTLDTSSYKGKRTVTFNAPRRDNPYHQKKEAVIDAIRTRIDKLILKAKPDYTAVEETIYQQGTAIGRHRLQLLLNVAWLCDAVVDSKRSARESAFYHINTHYLAIMRELYGSDTVYQDHENVACTDHFIPESDRFYGKRRKKKA